jgi:penicillin-insensitive murein endopeptidase
MRGPSRSHVRLPGVVPAHVHALVLAVTLALAPGAVGCVGPFAARAAPASAADSSPRETSARAAATGGSASPADDGCEDVASAAPTGAAAADDGPDAEHTTLDDGFEPPAQAGPTPAQPGAPAAPAPFADLTDAELEARLRADVGALGPMSIGRTNGGALVSGIRMPEGANWQLVSPGLAWGTKETIDGLAHAIDAVAARFPDTPKAFIGDISAKNGGHLHPHVSHQSGRDVDLGYYLTEGHRWYANASGSALDRARTWHLVRTLIADSDVEMILVDLSIQRVLKAYALSIGEDAAWLDEVFQVGGKSRRPLIFHVKGHATHLHIRFFNPVAQELGRRAYRFMVARRLVAPPTLYVTHTVKPGETLSHLAVRYKVTPEAIKKANAMAKDVVRVNKPYKIPQPGGIAMPAPASIPPRRVPPSPTAVAARSPGIGVTPCRRATAR